MIPFHSLLLHYKTELINWAIFGGGVLGCIGLLANDVTSPKILAVMVFLSDWNMLWTWEWWTRMIIFLALSMAAWFLQKRKYDKRFATQQTEWASKVASLQAELNHVELMFSAAQVRLAVLEGTPKKRK